MQPLAPPFRQQRPSRRRIAASTWSENPLIESTARVLLALLIVGAPMLLGGVLPWTVFAITSASLCCLAWVVVFAPARRNRVPFLAVLMGIAALWTACQVMPQPCSFVTWLAPQSVQRVREAAMALGTHGPLHCVVSRDPGATREEIVKGAAIVAAFLAAWLYAASGGRRYIFWVFAMSSSLMALVALVHGALKLDSVFGLYTPVRAKRELLLAPLMNPNQLGAFVATGAPLWLGLTYRSPNLNVRLLGFGAILIAALTTALTASRGAIGQFVASMLLMFWIATTRSHAGTGVHERRVLGAAVAVLLVTGLGVIAYLLGGSVAQEFARGDITKLMLIGKAIRFALAAPWVGIGRGAFSSSFVGVEGQEWRFAYAENFVAQWLAEWGLPITVLLLYGFGHAVLKAALDAASLAHLSALTAIGGFAAQNLVDFGMEQVGLAVVAAALLAASIAPSAKRKASTSADPPRILGRTTALAYAVLGVGTAALVSFGPGISERRVRTLEAKLRAQMASHNTTGFRQTLTKAVMLHPSEPLFALLAAAHGVASRDAGTGRWLNRTMQLAPGWLQPHVLSYRWLWQQGRHDQALLELRSAAERDPQATAEEVCRLVRLAPRLALAASPTGKMRRAYLEMAARCVPLEHPSEPVIDDVLLRDFPDCEIAAERRALHLHKSGSPDRGLALLDDALLKTPSSQRLRLTRASILLGVGRARDAIGELDRAPAPTDDNQRRDFIRVKALGMARLGDADAAHDLVDELRRFAGADAARLAESYAFAGHIARELHRPGEAFSAYREAYRINNDTAYLWAVAGLAQSIGDHREALWAFVRLCEDELNSPACAKRDELSRSKQQ